MLRMSETCFVMVINYKYVSEIALLFIFPCVSSLFFVMFWLRLLFLSYFLFSLSSVFMAHEQVDVPKVCTITTVSPVGLFLWSRLTFFFCCDCCLLSPNWTQPKPSYLLSLAAPSISFPYLGGGGC